MRGQQSSGPSPGAKDQNWTRTPPDQTPEQVFVELKELLPLRCNSDRCDDGSKWRPRARWTRPQTQSLTQDQTQDLSRTLSAGSVLLDRTHRTWTGLMETVVDQMVTLDQIRAEDRDQVLRVLLLPHSDEDAGEVNENKSRKRDGLGPDPNLDQDLDTDLDQISGQTEATVVLSGGVSFLSGPLVALVHLQEPVLFHSVLQVPVRFIFVFLGPSSSEDHLRTGLCIAKLMSHKSLNEAMSQAVDRGDLLRALTQYLDTEVNIPLNFTRTHREQPAVKSNGKEQDLSLLGAPPEDPLRRSGRLFGGLLKDVRRRYPQYVSDLSDALNAQCVAAIIFIYFAALSPAVTFGGLLGEKTQGLMGVSELIVATSVQGLVFAVLGAQPLLIVGFSGPLMVFEEAFFNFCQVLGVEYLTGRLWVGLWLVLIVLVTVALEGSVLVRFVSRFTQEIFSFLISLIFIYETFVKLFKIFQQHPLKGCFRDNSSEASDWSNSSEASDWLNSSAVAMHAGKGQPNTALLSLVLMGGTYLSAFYLRKFKNSSFFPGRLRRIIGDFGVPIAIFIMVLVDYSIQDTYTQKLSVPSGLSVSSPQRRSWLVPPRGAQGQFPVWMMAASALPAVLVFILLFMESQITALIVSKRVVKGTGFHADLLIIVLVGGVSAIFGLPWLSAATVRSVTHTNALTVTAAADRPRPQEVKEQDKPRPPQVREQRVTGFMVALLVGLSVLVAELLRQIPVAVLFGVFLYMGVMSLQGIQLTERLRLMLMPPKHHPKHGYTNKVRPWRMHLFTCLQLTCLSLLWAVMATPLALAFPFVLLLTVPLRKLLLPLLFTPQELQLLDSEQDQEQDQVQDQDQDQVQDQDEYEQLQMPV